MIEPTDFSIDEAAEPPAEGGRGAPPPVIVIEYRQRGVAARLVPPALILLAALAISSYQRTTAVPLPASRPRPPAPALALAEPTNPKIVVRAVTRGAPAAEKEKDKEKENENGKEARPDPQPPAEAPAPLLTLKEPAAPSPFELDPADGLRPLDAAAEVVADARPEPEPATAPGPPDAAPGPVPPEVSKDEILRDIRREAELKKAQQQGLEELKPRARALLQAEALAKVQSSRVPFRNELRRLLKERGEEAGPEIDRLCDEFGREMYPESRQTYYRVLRTAPARLGRQAMVQLMRTSGLPEPVILDYLAHGLHKTMNTRGGPRDEDQVRVRAAQYLLTIPVVPAGNGNAAPAGAGAGPPARSVSAVRARP